MDTEIKNLPEDTVTPFENIKDFLDDEGIWGEDDYHDAASDPGKDASELEEEPTFYNEDPIAPRRPGARGRGNFRGRGGRGGLGRRELGRSDNSRLWREKSPVSCQKIGDFEDPFLSESEEKKESGASDAKTGQKESSGSRVSGRAFTSSEGEGSFGSNKSLQVISYKDISRDLIKQCKAEGITSHPEYVDIYYQGVMANEYEHGESSLRIFLKGIRAEKLVSQQTVMSGMLDKLSKEISKISMVQKDLEESRMKYESRLVTVTETLPQKIMTTVEEKLKEIPIGTSGPAETLSQTILEQEGGTKSGPSSSGSKTRYIPLEELPEFIGPDLIDMVNPDELVAPSTKQEFLKIATEELGFGPSTLENEKRCAAIRMGPSKMENLILYNGLASDDLKKDIMQKIKNYFREME